uniref:Uncharacterized protein n=1 Tax=Lepeophtheirus salmonis TaxID=72036 RepID=A0A0K2UP99_LEPSM
MEGIIDCSRIILWLFRLFKSWRVMMESIMYGFRSSNTCDSSSLLKMRTFAKSDFNCGNGNLL